ncbi:hypothetical protein LCGC14_1343190 [marine sediment metagenome]|uniref:Uncharacterized protein n=1 Tax=marine sediment metagenome TaxID=412755 RepID=A0A0F9MTY1_9ZZZZ
MYHVDCVKDKKVGFKFKCKFQFIKKAPSFEGAL